MILKYLRRRVRDYCSATYRARLKLTRAPQGPSFNHACHWNSDAMLRRGECVAIAECVLVSSSSVDLHYVPIMAEKVCCDPTLGIFWENADYRLVRVIGAQDDPGETLLRVKREIACAAGVPSWVVRYYGEHRLL